MKIHRSGKYHYVCRQCGSELFYDEPDAIYCEECGANLKDASRKNDNVLPSKNI